MSSFSDTFTKNSEQEDLLNYDDSAAYYFTASVLTCIVLPWSWAWIRHFMWGATTSSFPEKTMKGSTQKYCRNGPMEANVDKIEAMAAAKEKKNKRWNVLKLIGLAILWCALIFCCFQLADDSMGDSIKVFNPFDILEVSPGSDDATVKKAYRKMSLIYHPDKNPDDPLASAKFIQVSKAYTALTDPAAKANYEKYGNPDGPQTTKVGIGLPRFLLEKQNHLLILCSFFVILLVVIPAFFITYYQRQKHYAPNGVLVETLQFLGHYVGEQTKLKNGPELLAASAESRSMDVRPEDDEEMKPIVTAVVEHQKHMFKEPAIVVRNNYLIWAHMQRLHHLMSEDLQLELNTLLAQTNKVCSAMVEIACLREWYATAVEKYPNQVVVFEFDRSRPM